MQQLLPRWYLLIRLQKRLPGVSVGCWLFRQQYISWCSLNQFNYTAIVFSFSWHLLPVRRTQTLRNNCLEARQRLSLKKSVPSFHNLIYIPGGWHKLMACRWDRARTADAINWSNRRSAGLQQSADSVCPERVVSWSRIAALSRHQQLNTRLVSNDLRISNSFNCSKKTMNYM